MPGVVIVSNDSGEIAKGHYSSKTGRNSLLSFYNLFYDLDLTDYSITISPDDFTEDQTQAQCLNAGCYNSYMRAGGVFDDGSCTDSSMVR